MLRFRDLENLDKDNLFDLLEGISEEQVENSDVGGDSDAEDGPSSTLTTTSNDRRASRSPELGTFINFYVFVAKCYFFLFDLVIFFPIT